MADGRCPGPFQDAIAARVLSRPGWVDRHDAAWDVMRRYGLSWDEVMDVLRKFRRAPLWGMGR